MAGNGGVDEQKDAFCGAASRGERFLRGLCESLISAARPDTRGAKFRVWCIAGVEEDPAAAP